LRQVSKVYPGGIEAVSDLDLAIADGELLAIVGPSGSGKTTVLRLIAGLESLSAGSLWIDGLPADELPPSRRDVAMVFQNHALYPHMRVYENVAFGLRSRGLAAREVRGRVVAAAELLRVGDLLDRRPNALSGGQRQRVALARAVARRPKLMLLDEPLSHLDAPLRAAMRADLIDLHRQLGTTMVLVTHDQAEALAVGDRVAILDGGRLVQVAAPRALYETPATRFVAGFIGWPPMNLLRCQVDFADALLRLTLLDPPAQPAFAVPRGTSWIAPLERQDAAHVEVGIRSEHVVLIPRSDRSSDSSELGAPVRRIESTGGENVITLAIGERDFRLRVAADVQRSVGEVVDLWLDPTRASWFDAESGRRIE
jgi:ABC-type sugar transport system ATPase subunit